MGVEERARALSESESLKGAILASSLDAIIVIDHSGRIVEFNPAAERCFGFTRDQAIGQQMAELIIPAELRDRHYAGLRRYLETGLGPLLDRRIEMPALRAGGARFDAELAITRILGSEPPLFAGTLRDLSEQKRAERALVRSEQRFRSFMDNMPAIAWIKDSRLRYAWVSPRHEQAHGRSLEELRGRDDFELWPEEVARQFRREDERALKENLSVQAVDHVPFANGSEGHWLVVKFPLPDATGAMGVGGIAIDITERVELEKALKENQARVGEATEVVRQLMNRLVHAQEAERRKVAADLHDLIGQKLTALGINLDIVRQRMPQAGAAALAPRLHQMSTLLEETIEAIREVMSDLRPQVLDEHGLSAALYQYASVFEARTGLRIQVKGAEHGIPLPHDVAIALFRIAQEALANAAKHSHASVVEVRVHKSPQCVELFVEDNGSGLPDAGVCRPGNGHGWGLRMMRERAEAVGGTLSVDNPGQGTQIAVKVPLDHADQRHPG